jgi:site-specific DNA recombinase
MSARAAVYARISRDRVGAGLGVDRQEQDCRALAAQLGWSITVVRADNDISAYSGKPRPGYLALLDDIRAGRIDAVLAWHTDRLHRSPIELETYIAACDQHGVPTHCVKAGALDLATPSGRLVARQLGAVARYEVEHMIERQRRAKEQTAADGKWLGGRRPYGYEADGVTIRTSEAAEVLRASRSVLSGTSLRSIAADLNARELVTSTGKPWRQDTVRKVLLRPRNAGLMEHRGKVVGEASWPAIVPEELWRGVVAVLTDPVRRTQFSSVRRWMGSGLYVCHCGALVRSYSNGTGRDWSHVAYACTSGVKHLTRKADEVDDLVTEFLIERLRRPGAAEVLDGPAAQDTSDDRVQVAALRARLDELAALFAAGDLNASQLRTASALLQRQLTEAESRIADSSRTQVLVGLVDQADPAAAWAGLDIDRRRAVIHHLMTVTLLPSGKGRRKGWKPGESYFDPSTVRIDWKV